MGELDAVELAAWLENATQGDLDLLNQQIAMRSYSLDQRLRQVEGHASPKVQAELQAAYTELAKLEAKRDALAAKISGSKQQVEAMRLENATQGDLDLLNQQIAMRSYSLSEWTRKREDGHTPPTYLAEIQTQIEATERELAELKSKRDALAAKISEPKPEEAAPGYQGGAFRSRDCIKAEDAAAQLRKRAAELSAKADEAKRIHDRALAEDEQRVAAWQAGKLPPDDPRAAAIHQAFLDARGAMNRANVELAAAKLEREDADARADAVCAGGSPECAQATVAAKRAARDLIAARAGEADSQAAYSARKAQVAQANARYDDATRAGHGAGDYQELREAERAEAQAKEQLTRASEAVREAEKKASDAEGRRARSCGEKPKALGSERIASGRPWGRILVGAAALAVAAAIGVVLLAGSSSPGGVVGGNGDRADFSWFGRVDAYRSCQLLAPAERDTLRLPDTGQIWLTGGVVHLTGTFSPYINYSGTFSSDGSFHLKSDNSPPAVLDGRLADDGTVAGTWDLPPENAGCPGHMPMSGTGPAHWASSLGAEIR